MLNAGKFMVKLELRKQFGSVSEYKILYYNNPNTAKVIYTKKLVLKGQLITA